MLVDKQMANLEDNTTQLDKTLCIILACAFLCNFCKFHGIQEPEIANMELQCDYLGGFNQVICPNERDQVKVGGEPLHNISFCSWLEHHPWCLEFKEMYKNIKI